MRIEVNPPKSIVLVPEMSQTVDELLILNMMDDPNRKIVTATISRLGTVTLWEGADYDAAGQWTDTDVINRLKAIYNIP